MSDPGVDTQVARALARERSKAGEWLTRFWPILASLVIAAVTVLGGYFSFRAALEDAATKAHESIEILHGDPRKGVTGLIELVRTNSRELERRREERSREAAEVIRRLDTIQAQQSTLNAQQTAVLERMARMETKLEERSR